MTRRSGRVHLGWLAVAAALIFGYVLLVRGTGSQSVTTDTAARVQSLPYTRVSGQGMAHFVVMDTVEGRAAFEIAGGEVCRRYPSPVCSVGFWQRAADAPSMLPMTDAQVRAQTASFWINRSSPQGALNCHPFGTKAERCAS